MIDLSIVRIIIALLVLVYASYSDLKNRYVSPKLWLFLGVAASILIVADGLRLGFDRIKWILTPIIIVGFVAIYGFYLNLWKGGDAKGFIGLALMFPFFIGGILANAFLIGAIGVFGYWMVKKERPKRIPFVLPLSLSFVLTIIGFDVMWKVFILVG